MLDSGYPVCNLNKLISVFGEFTRERERAAEVSNRFNWLFRARQVSLSLCMNMCWAHVVSEWACRSRFVRARGARDN